MNRASPRAGGPAAILLMLTFSAIFGQALAPAAAAQTVSAGAPGAGAGPAPWRSSHVIVPQARSYWVAASAPPATGLQITSVETSVDISQLAAVTVLEVRMKNNGSARTEAELLVPVPDKAAVRGFLFDGAALEPTARLLPRDEAKRTYEAIVAKSRDPALLEFIGANLVQSSVFPIEAGGTQRVRLIYEHLLTGDSDRIDYVLPRSESIEYATPWKVTVRIASPMPISTIYSPSHRMESRRVSSRGFEARANLDQPGPFRLSYLLERQAGGIPATLTAYPDPKIGGGYFLLLAGSPPSQGLAANSASTLKREVTLVLDRSGSMSGEKIRQVREAAIQVIGGLDDGERFRIIIYNEGVETFSNEPVAKSEAAVEQARKYLAAELTPRGGTNIHDALVEALRSKATPGSIPIILFMTDGLPTIGQTSESAIRSLGAAGNPQQKRIFTFGVGVDVNTPLLEGIAFDTRASSTFILPQEDVEVKVAGVFKRLSGPVLADPILKEESARARVVEMFPSRLPDIFEGDQLVILGRYKGDDPLEFRLEGNFRGQAREFRFKFPLEKASVRNAYVPRLWASRKIGILIDGIRKLGAGASEFPPRNVSQDPRIKELVDEIVKLSTEFGILTEYTAFFADQGTDLTRKGEVAQRALSNFQSRAIQTRSGYGAVNQELNNASLKDMQCVNPLNGFWNAKLDRVEIATVQQINDCVFYRKGSQWIDGRYIDNVDKVKPERVIRFGSPEFLELAQRLAAQGRQGNVSLRGDILLNVDGQPVLIQGPEQAAAPQQERGGPQGPR